MAETVLGTPQDRPYTEVGEAGAVRMPTISSEQVRAARGLLGWEKQDLAEATGLSVETIKAIERRPGALMVRTTTLYALQDAFNRNGVEFFDAGDIGGGGAGVRWKERRR